MVRVDVARSVASRLRGPDVQVFEELLHDGRRGLLVALAERRAEPRADGHLRLVAGEVGTELRGRVLADPVVQAEARQARAGAGEARQAHAEGGGVTLVIVAPPANGAPVERHGDQPQHPNGDDDDHVGAASLPQRIRTWRRVLAEAVVSGLAAHPLGHGVVLCVFPAARAPEVGRKHHQNILAFIHFCQTRICHF